MRLKEDSSSWRSRGIKRRDFRHDPGTPDTEVPRRTHAKGKNKKHVHKYKQTILGLREVERRYHSPIFKGKTYTAIVYDMQYYCEGCGHRTSHRGW